MCRFPRAKRFAPSTAKLRRFGLAAPLCPSSQHVYHQESAKRYETSSTVSASLSTGSYLGQGLAEQYVPARAPPNPELRRQETHSFPISVLKEGGKNPKPTHAALAARYPRGLQSPVRGLQ